MEAAGKADARDAIAYTDSRYLPQMVDWAADNISSLIHNDGVSPKDIVILSAFLPDAQANPMVSNFAIRSALNVPPFRCARIEFTNRPSFGFSGKTVGISQWP